MTSLLTVVVCFSFAGQEIAKPTSETQDSPVVDVETLPRFSPDIVRPFKDLDARVHADDARAIEPTSPVLGTELVSAIRRDVRSPNDILRAIDLDYPDWERDITLSTLAYLRTLTPELGKTTSRPATMTLVEHAAIPLEILQPLHARYAGHARSLVAQASWSNADDAQWRAAAKKSADSFRRRRAEVARVRPLRNLAGTVAFICPGPCADFIRLNVDVASPEDAFPRGQYSVNGFTTYVYDRLIEHPRLRPLLETVFRAEKEWVDAVLSGSPPIVTFIEHVEVRAAEANFLRRDVFLVLAYSLRNMPSIDVHYAEDARAALALEVYFWKFRQFRDAILEKEILPHFSPTHAFDVNPGLYHFTTAAIHACELRRAGFPSLFAQGAAASGKIVYKTHKLLTAVDEKELAAAPITHLSTLAVNQGFFSGVETGWFGGGLGALGCAEAK